MGARSYAELPSYLAGWDVCIQPFARNESTRFISPTKTLEYMAAGLPIISTPITDVAEQYSHIVYLGSTPQEYIQACEQALSETPQHAQARREEGQRILAQTSWDNTAQAIEDLIVQAYRDRSPIVVGASTLQAT
jgi:UDP-galactopyranose mutase